MTAITIGYGKMHPLAQVRKNSRHLRQNLSNKHFGRWIAIKKVADSLLNDRSQQQTGARRALRGVAPRSARSVAAGDATFRRRCLLPSTLPSSKTATSSTALRFFYLPYLKEAISSTGIVKVRFEMPSLFSVIVLHE